MRNATVAGEIRQLIEANARSSEESNALAVYVSETTSGIPPSLEIRLPLQAANWPQYWADIAVAEMDSTTQQNASMIEDSASAAESLKGMLNGYSRQLPCSVCTVSLICFC